MLPHGPIVATTTLYKYIHGGNIAAFTFCLLRFAVYLGDARQDLRFAPHPLPMKHLHPHPTSSHTHLCNSPLCFFIPRSS